jgi:dolichyl-phosphate-mannose--protein O-mannosyl transferase
MLTFIVPQIGVPRIMWLYHYFAVLPFSMMVLTWALKCIAEKTKQDYHLYIFLAAVLTVFVYFYPVYSGMPISKEYKDKTQWMNKIFPSEEKNPGTLTDWIYKQGNTKDKDGNDKDQWRGYLWYY